MEYLIIGLVSVIISVHAGESGFHWGYLDPNGPTNWTKGFAKCGGSHQSPINVPDFDHTIYTDIELFTFHGFDNPNNYELTLVNNGHSAQLNIKGDVYITGGGLVGKYNTAQLHFHWGEDDHTGSENLLRDRHFPMEMHVVNWNDKYGTIGNAAPKPDGLAVLAFWFVAVRSENRKYRPLIRAVESITFKGEEKKIEGLNIRNLLPRHMNKFYRYQGSLTTPPCHESVTWSIFNSKISIGRSQIAKFRNTFEEPKGVANKHHIEMNFRPPQPLNDRKVYRNFESETSSASKIKRASLCYIILFLITVAYL